MKAPRSYQEWLVQMRATEKEAESRLHAAPPAEFDTLQAYWMECRICLQDMETDVVGYTAWCLADNNEALMRPLLRFPQ